MDQKDRDKGTIRRGDSADPATASGEEPENYRAGQSANDDLSQRRESRSSGEAAALTRREREERWPLG